MIENKKYRMIVLDDEYLVRLGIRETIEWDKYNIEIVGDATNGRDGLTLAKEKKPDIIISDIKMPIMDGKEFVKEIKLLKLDVICIMLSGYKDFEYAKDTLENGAFAYLLKPIDNQKLIEMVLNAIQELVKRRDNVQKLKAVDDNLPLIKTTIIQKLLSGNLSQEEFTNYQLHYNELKIPVNGYVIYSQIDNATNYSNSVIVKKANEDLYKLINLFLDIENNNSSILYYSHFVIIIENNNLINIEQKITKAINTFEKDHEEIISIGISSIYTGYEEIYEKYLEARLNAKNKILLTLNTLATPNNNQMNYRKAVVDALKYIANNFQYNFDIDTVSHDLDISPSHLMHIFKEDVGETFNECLTKYRILMAKKYLISNKYKVYEVSSMVGFNDTKYFSQIFKKIVGKTPIQFASGDETL